jgi:hypothetical protein
MSHDTTIIATIERNYNNIINFHNVLKMIIDYKEFVFEFLFIHKERLALGSFQETFNSCFGYDFGLKNSWV